MADASEAKVEAASAAEGPEGQKYLASGRSLSMRLWEGEPSGATKDPVRRDYETVGYVIAGRAELEIEGVTTALEKGSSWVVPKGAAHTYRILETFTAVEATAPPAESHNRDAV